MSRWLIIGYGLGFAALLSIGQLVRWQLTPTATLLPIEVWMGLGLLGMGWLQPSPYHQLWHWLRRHRWLLAAVVIWVGMGWLFAIFREPLPLRTFLYAVRLIYYGGFGVLVWLAAKQSNTVRQTTLRSLLLTTLLWWWFGVMQYFFWPDTRVLFFLGWDDHYYRLVSTLLDPGFTGILLIISLGLWLSTLSTSLWNTWFRPTQQRWIFPGTLLLSWGFITALLFTYSRASYLAFIAFGGVALLHFWQHLRWRWGIILTLIFFAAAIPFLPRPDGEGVKLERTASAISRSAQWQLELSRWQGSVILIGRGLFVPANGDQGNEYDSPAHGQMTENWLLLLLTQLGLPGFVVMSWGVIQGWWLLRRWPWLQATFTAVLVHGLFNATVTYPAVWLLAIGGGVMTQLPQTSKILITHEK